MPPLISVIIPTYNRASVLGVCIEAVLKQKFTDWELVVVDDGSTDLTEEVVFPYLQDKRCKYIKQENKGVSAARNKGASVANGEYLVFLDSDDEVTLNWLSDFAKSLNDSLAELCFCGALYDFGRKSTYNKINFLAGAFCIKTDIFFKAGLYDERLNFAENTELGWRIIDLNPKIDFISDLNFKYIRSGKEGLNYINNRLNAFYYLQRKHCNRFKQFSSLGQTYFQIAAVDNIRLMKYREGKKLMWQGYLLQLTNFKALFRAVSSSLKPLAKSIWKPIET
jgi:glycosyltransferase involved in cell wall biosynthesis